MDEIEQADVFKERIHAMMIDIDKALKMRESVAAREESQPPIENLPNTAEPRTPTGNLPYTAEPRTPTGNLPYTAEPRTPTGNLPYTTEPRTPTGNLLNTVEPRTPTGTIPITVADIPTIPFGHGQVSRVRLPKLTMRQFDGDLTKWSTFWDSFESSIHNSRELSCVDKFNYLNSLLE